MLLRHVRQHGILQAVMCIGCFYVSVQGLCGAVRGFCRLAQLMEVGVGAGGGSIARGV
jgi:hypothetical protein